MTLEVRWSPAGLDCEMPSVMVDIGTRLSLPPLGGVLANPLSSLGAIENPRGPRRRHHFPERCVGS